MDPAGSVVFIQMGEESPKEGHGANLKRYTKLASCCPLYCENGKVDALTFFGAQSNIGLLRFSKMWKLGFFGGSSSVSGVRGLESSGTE